MYFQVYQTKVFRNTFYCSNIRSLLSYATPAWFTLLGDTNLEKLEKVPCSANRIILPNYEYDECLEMLCIPSLAKFLHELRQRDSSNIVSDSSHPLFSRLSFNYCRVSSCNDTIYKPRWCRTQKRAKSVILFFMSGHNRWVLINLIYILSQSTCKHLLLSLLW